MKMFANNKWLAMTLLAVALAAAVWRRGFAQAVQHPLRRAAAALPQMGAGRKWIFHSAPCQSARVRRSSNKKVATRFLCHSRAQ